MTDFASPSAATGFDPGLFPDENPNPVMRVELDGSLSYANAASEPVRRSLGVAVGDVVSVDFLDRLANGARFSPPEPFEMAWDVRTFAILAVRVGDAYNVYGSDVTGAKVVEKFPDRNPNPVLRTNPEGRLLYANAASAPIIHALGVEPGDLVPSDLDEAIRARLSGGSQAAIEVRGAGRIYELAPVLIPEFGFVNLYGTDVTALRAIDKFPDANPNAVLRATRDGTVTYANPASAPLAEAFGIAVGDMLPAGVKAEIDAIVASGRADVLAVEHDGRTYEVRVVSLFEFESINLYGTDVTAAREVERANRENERLLLNILPPTIAQRLRGGEVLIADAFDDMAVLFADVVDFTPYSAAHPAQDVVSVLNEVFSLFDALVDRHRLEKIKTIGDAYMAVGGLTVGQGGVTALADMALDILDEMAAYRPPSGDPMSIRVGLHVGPGIGGVIGLKKFIYDVWGDTVNTASRLESHGVPGRIQVAAATAERLADRYAFEPRGTLQIKGKGSMETCFLVARR
ncbi:MAG: adenylate/guanylate cyclase domain-containing protein [Chloroflexota bacterium]